MAGDAFWDWICELEDNLKFDKLQGGHIGAPMKLYPGHLGLGHPDIDPKYDKPVQAGCYQVLTNDTMVKYLIYAFPDSERDEYARIKWPFGFTELPDEPGVDWNIGYLSKPSREADCFIIRSTVNKTLAGIPCPLTDIPRVQYPYNFFTPPLDHTLIQAHGFHQPRRIAELKYRVDGLQDIVEFDPNKVLLAIDTEWRDFGRKNYQRLWTSATIHAAVHEHDITPRVLAYMTEDINGRVIGMAVELLDNVRVAGIEDIEECRAVLGKLHSLGILCGGGLGRLSYLIVEEEEKGEKRKKALMQGFTESEFCDDKEQMKMEMDKLPEVLQSEVELRRLGWMSRHREASKLASDPLDWDPTSVYSPVSPVRYRKDEKL